MAVVGCTLSTRLHRWRFSKSPFILLFEKNDQLTTPLQFVSGWPKGYIRCLPKIHAVPMHIPWHLSSSSVVCVQIFFPRPLKFNPHPFLLFLVYCSPLLFLQCLPFLTTPFVLLLFKLRAWR